MELCKLVCNLFIVVCCLGRSGDGVRLRPGMSIPIPIPIRTSSHVTRRPRINHMITTGRRKFHATTERCCDVGERVAKKKMSCSLAVVAAVKRYRNKTHEKPKYTKRTSKRSRYSFRRYRRRKLTEKILSCTAHFPTHFIKCCSAFQRHIKKCRVMPRRQRRRCKKAFVRRSM